MTIESLYYNGLFATMILLFIFGWYFVSGKIPNAIIFETYKRSRFFMGLFFLQFGVMYVLLFFSELRMTQPLLASVINLASYYLAAFLVGFSLISLLDKTYITQKRIVFSALRWGCFVVYLVFSVYYFTPQHLRMAIMTGSCWFLLEAGRITLHFIVIYRRARKELDNYYSEDVKHYVQWISKVAFWAIVFGLGSSIITYLPKFYILLWVFSGLLYFPYIFFSFINYLLFYEQIKRGIETSDSIPEKECPAALMSDDVLNDVIGGWVNRSGFVQQGVTIEKLATLLGTNRTYLSSFINHHYTCSFREWITKRRLEHAKTLLDQFPNKPITEISTLSGFASHTHFSRVFTEAEGMSPARWKDGNREAKIMVNDKL